jgi:predicted RNase H-like HicB family nuclease
MLNLNRRKYDIDMFTEYIQAALERAQYKLIDNGDEPCFADVPELDGVWATGRNIEDARKELIEVLEEWIAARLMWGLPIPPISGQSISCLGSFLSRVAS